MCFLCLKINTRNARKYHETIITRKVIIKLMIIVKLFRGKLDYISELAETILYSLQQAVILQHSNIYS